MNAKTLRTVVRILNDAGIDLYPNRVQVLGKIVESLGPDSAAKLRIETCTHGGGDPNRYGNAACRAGRAKRLGVTGTGGPGTTKQIWAVWA